MIKLKSIISELYQPEVGGKFIAYHGTGARFEQFDLNMSTHGIVWFTSNRDSIINGENGAHGRKFIITAELTMGNPADWDEYDKKSMGELRRDGYDGVILDSTEDDDIDYIMWDIDRIKILKIEPTGL